MVTNPSFRYLPTRNNDNSDNSQNESLAAVLWILFLLSLFVPTKVIASQEDTYRASSEQCGKAKKSQGTSMMIHGAAAGVCAYSCVQTKFAFGAEIPEPACTASSIGAGVADMFMADDMANSGSSAMMSLGAAALPFLMKGKGAGAAAGAAGGATAGAGGAAGAAGGATAGAGGAAGGAGGAASGAGGAAGGAGGAAGGATAGAGAAAPAAGGSLNMAACLAAGLEVAQMAMKAAGKKDSEECEEENEFKADELKSVALKADRQSSETSIARGAVGGSNSAEGASTAAINDLSNCDGLKSTSTSAFLSCAVSADPTLPDFVAKPEFADQFKHATGLNLGDFLNAPSDTNAKQALSAALNKTQGPETAAALLDEMDSRLKKLNSDVSGTAYAGGGGSRGSGSGQDDGMGQINDLMGKFFGQGDKKDKKDPGGKVDFNSLDGRDPKSIVRDRTVSLFTRVTHRYQQSQGKVAQLPWASRYNRSIAGSR